VKTPHIPNWLQRSGEEVSTWDRTSRLYRLASDISKASDAHAVRVHVPTPTALYIYIRSTHDVEVGLSALLRSSCQCVVSETVSHSLCSL
jgi:hypothetical protein